MITFVCGVVGILLGLVLLVKDITKTSDEALKMYEEPYGDTETITDINHNLRK